MEYQNREEMKQDLLAVFASGCKAREDFALGVELEHFLVHRGRMQRVYYDEPGGVREVLEKLVDQEGMEPIFIDGHLMGAQDDKTAISLEPGAQFELSLNKNPSIPALREEYRQSLEKVYRVLDPMDLALVRLSLDPVHSPEEIPLIPKDRYRIMTAYMGERGKYSTTMMRLTCSLQFSIDYADEADFIKKYQTLTWMAPILYTLSDGALLHLGQPSEDYNLHQEVWRFTDPDRTGILPGVFDEDFGWGTYADWLLDRPLLFIPEAEGSREVGDMTLAEALSQAKSREEADRIIQHALTIVFPDIRLKKYLEIRVLDQVPPAWGLAFAALIKGLFYDQENLDQLAALAQGTNERNVERGKDAGRDNGLQGYYFSDYFAHWGIRLAELAKKGLPAEEQVLLQPLLDGMNALENPRYLFEQTYKAKGFDEAIREQMVFPDSL